MQECQINDRTTRTAAVLVSHGSPRAEANEQFTQMVRRVAGRLEGVAIEPAFFSLAEPTIAQQIARLAEGSVAKILVLPYFLHNGQHVRVDLPEQLDLCRAENPGVEIVMGATLRDEPALEDVLVHRLTEHMPVPPREALSGPAIEQKSHRLIDERIGGRELEPGAHAIVRRVVHATADFSFAETMRIHPDAPRRGVDALGAGGPVICDVNMLRSGVTRVGCEVLCAVADEDVAERAADGEITRSAAAMEKLSSRFGGAIVAVGNAPTAIWEVLEIADKGGPRPALVVGVPVGFVGALESKLALLRSDLCFITNVGNRGGSPVAAAVLNALANLAEERS